MPLILQTCFSKQISKSGTALKYHQNRAQRSICTYLVQLYFWINEMHFFGAIITNKALAPSFATISAVVSSDTVSINGNNFSQSHLSEMEGTLILKIEKKLEAAPNQEEGSGASQACIDLVIRYGGEQQQ
ncbi:hypothetical protein [Herminiimonas aquatilis]|uniref:IPT/TIG domain-containing protein n=1 Tax=Herminiimonas aquatilis TaxID=345342 RepID=A0ABW2J9T7_9BURK